MADTSFENVSESGAIDGETIKIVVDVKSKTEPDPEVRMADEVRWINHKVLELEKRIKELERKQKWGML